MKKSIHGILCVRHENETLCSISKKFPSVIFKCPFIIGYDISYFTLEFTNNSDMLEENLTECLDMLERDKDVKFFEVIERSEYKVRILIAKRAFGVLKALYDTRSVFKGPFIVKNGVKYFPIVTYTNPQELEEKVKSYCPKKAEVWFKLEETFDDYEFYETHSAIQPLLNELTQAERRALIAAYELGYFEWPRIHNSSTVAEYLGISRATFAENLRKAEKKISRFLYKFLK